MNKDPQKLVKQITILVNELASLAGVKTRKASVIIKNKKKKPTGATGGLRFLIDEGYFDSPKELPEVINKLREEGWHYFTATVSMGLLNLVRERILTRYREKKGKPWKYVIRR
ncbi:MAG: hypothetical protein E3J36_02095 [Candidatus Nealsonbacteria bacterium]|nr:MAG: hypothetical protein E3J36_02095 [Candidatus Nealsonbacteria bacterium]